MKTKAVLMALAMMTTALAGCTSGTDGVPEMDEDALNDLIQNNLQDFINNTTVVVNQDFHYHNNTNETTTTTNHINGSEGSSNSIHVLAGVEAGNSELGLNYSEDNVLALLVREDAYPADVAMNSAANLGGANICVGIGTWMESEIQNYYAQSGNSFTAIGVANQNESVDKLISGECDALGGSLSSLDGLRVAIQNSVDAWVTNGIGQMANSSSGGYSWLAGSNTLSLTISQSAGEAAVLNIAYSEITLTGTCVSNCAGQNDTISQTIVFGLNDESLNSLIFDQPPSIVPSSTCEYEFSDYDWAGWGGTFGPYGLECELTLTMTAQFGLTSSWYPFSIYNFEDYEFEWSDWTYYVMWSSTPVTMHE